MWLVGAGKQADARLRLFCFPHAGAGVSAYGGWASDLAPEIELITVQLPGREGRFREANFEDFSALISQVTNAILPHLDRPYALFGNSFGALAAFEVAHQITGRTGHAPTYLFASACGAPQLIPWQIPIGEFPDDELLPELDRRYSGIPAVIKADREFLQAVLPAIRADLRMLELYSYSARPPLPCPIQAFGGARDATLTREHLEAWDQQTSAVFRLDMLDETHLYLRSARTTLVSAIRRALTRAISTCQR